MERLTGLDIPFELQRIVTLPEPERPFMVVHATEPTHKAGVIHEGVKLDSFTKHLNNNKIERISITMTQMELGTKIFQWHSEIIEPKIEDRVLLWMEVYWLRENQRVGMRKGVFEELLATLPGTAEWKNIKIQKYLESILPKARPGPYYGQKAERIYSTASPNT